MIADAPRSTPSTTQRPTSRAFVGTLAGPLLAFLLMFTRIGPPGFLWSEGKDGPIETPLGRTIIWIILIVGAIAGSLCGIAFDAWGRPTITAAKLKRVAPQEHLWDHELDG